MASNSRLRKTSQEVKGKESGSPGDRSSSGIISSNTTPPTVNFEDIQIHVSDHCSALTDPKSIGKESSACSDGNIKELERDVRGRLPTFAADNEKGKTTSQQRRRIGIVEASEKALEARRNARVLRKKFGEGIISKTPGIFNKKL